MFQNLRVFDRPVVLRDMVYEFDTKNNAERKLRVFCSECFHIIFLSKANLLRRSHTKSYFDKL